MAGCSDVWLIWAGVPAQSESPGKPPSLLVSTKPQQQEKDSPPDENIVCEASGILALWLAACSFACSVLQPCAQLVVLERLTGVSSSSKKWCAHGDGKRRLILVGLKSVPSLSCPSTLHVFGKLFCVMTTGTCVYQRDLSDADMAPVQQQGLREPLGCLAHAFANVFAIVCSLSLNFQLLSIAKVLTTVAPDILSDMTRSMEADDKRWSTAFPCGKQINAVYVTFQRTRCTKNVFSVQQSRALPQQQYFFSYTCGPP